MASEVITFDSFQGGERGTINDWMNIPNTFRALNMIVLRTGEICVRPGLKDITPSSGVSNGKIWLYAANDNSSRGRWYIQGNQVFSFDGIGGAASAASGTLDETPTEPVPYVDAGKYLYFTVRGTPGHTYRFDTVGNAVTKLSAAPGGGRAIALYNELLMIGNISDANPNRMYWSDIADPSTWPADNFMDIDSFHGIGGMYVQNNHLTILKQESIWVLYGQPGYNETVRKALKINSGLSQYNGAAAFLDEIYFQGLGAAWPSKFNGSSAGILHNLEYTGVLNSGSVDMCAIPFRNRDEGVMLVSSDKKAAILLDNIWTFHQFGVSAIKAIGNNEGGVDNIALLTDGGADAAHPKLYVLDITKQSPGIEGSSFSRAGDDSSTPLAGTLFFPMRARRDGAESRVRSVIVNFRKWNTGASQNNHFDLALKAMRVTGSPVTTSVISFDEAVSSGTADGKEDRFIGNFPETVEGNAFQVQLSNIKGVAIQSVQIVVDGLGPVKH